jgi:hypothetical protein
MTNPTELEIDGEYTPGKIQAFLPEVWAADVLRSLRSNIVTVSWAAEPDMDEVAKVERIAAYRARTAAKQAEIAAMEARLKTFPDILQPIIELHHRDGGQCMGCDVDGYECEQPEWPCRTIQTILGDADE